MSVNLIFNRSVFFAALLTLALPVHGYAGFLRVDSETLGSMRNGDDQNFEAPIYEFLSGTFSTEQRRFEVTSDLTVFGDPAKNNKEFRLNLFDASFEAIPDHLRISGGRGFDVDHATRAATMDRGAIDLYLFQKRFSAGAFAGKEVRLETRRTDLPKALVAGGYVGYQTATMFPFRSKLKLEHRQYERPSDRSENWIVPMGSQDLPLVWNPEVLANGQFDPAREYWSRAEAGINLHPSYKSGIRLRGGFFDLRPWDGRETPLSSIFAQGRIYETSVELERRFTAELIGSLSFTYDNYLYQRPLRTDGFKVEGSFDFKRRWFGASNSIYVFRSMGGELYGNLISLTQGIGDRIDLNEQFDVSYYRKITSSRRFALHSEAGLNYHWSDSLSVKAGGELNSNNSLTYDLRAVLKITYRLWTET